MFFIKLKTLANCAAVFVALQLPTTISNFSNHHPLSIDAGFTGSNYSVKDSYSKNISKTERGGIFLGADIADSEISDYLMFQPTETAKSLYAENKRFSSSLNINETTGLHLASRLSARASMKGYLLF